MTFRSFSKSHLLPALIVNALLMPGLFFFSLLSAPPPPVSNDNDSNHAREINNESQKLLFAALKLYISQFFCE